jgi:hypothetical protein
LFFFVSLVCSLLWGLFCNSLFTWIFLYYGKTNFNTCLLFFLLFVHINVFLLWQNLHKYY